jgi:hypothetical protein
MMEETLQICERAQHLTQDASHLKTFPSGLRPSSDAHSRQPSPSRSNLGGAGHLATSRLSLAPAATRSTYRALHKGTRHTLCGCRLRKKIDKENNAPCRARTPMSPDVN